MEGSNSSITGSPAVDSVLVAGGATAGSIFATATGNDWAAITTIVATVATLAYQFTRVILENRRKSIEMACSLRMRDTEGQASLRVLEAHAARDAALIDAAGLRNSLIGSEAERLKLQSLFGQMARDEVNYREAARFYDSHLGKPDVEPEVKP